MPTSSLNYPTVHYHHIIKIIKEKVADGSLQFKKSEQDVDVNPLPHHDDRLVITVAVNYITNDNSSPIDVMMKDITEEWQTLKDHTIFPDNSLWYVLSHLTLSSSLY